MTKKITLPKGTKIPNHLAIIMDGNRRWAKKQSLPVLEGHRVAAEETIESLVEKASEVGISYLTFWAFSTENWQRVKKEVNGLMSIFRKLLAKKIEKLHQKGVRVLTIGDLSKFPQDIQKGIKNGIEKTRDNKKITVVLALNYGGRDEIIRAIEKWRSKSEIRPACQQGRNPKSEITEEEFVKYLDTSKIPDPDLIIRTGGEKRLSGFLLWQSEYSELYFTKVLFPDFNPQEFEKAIFEYQKRQRRFGK